MTGNLLNLRITISNSNTFLQSLSCISRHHRWSHHHTDNRVAEVLGNIVKRTMRHDFLLITHSQSLLSIVHNLWSNVFVHIFLHTHIQFLCALGNMSLHSLLRINLIDFTAEIVHQNVLTVYLLLSLSITESLFLYRLRRIDAAHLVKVLLILLTCQFLCLVHGRINQTEQIITQNTFGLSVIPYKLVTLNLILGKIPSIVLSLLLGSSPASFWSRKLLHRLVEVLGSRGYSASADRGSSLLFLTCRLFLCSLHARAHIASLSLLHRVHLVVAHVHQLPVLHIVCTRSCCHTRLLRSLRLLPMMLILSCHILCPLRSSHWLLLRYWLLLRLRIYCVKSESLRKLLIRFTGNSTVCVKRIIELLSVMIALLARRIHELSEMFSSSRYCAIGFQGVIKLVKFISSHILYINVYNPSFFVFL